MVSFKPRTSTTGGCRKFRLLFGRIGPLRFALARYCARGVFLPHSINVLQIRWWYGDNGLIWYVLRSPLRPLARPCIFDASISCSQNPISPEDVIERTGLFINPQLQSCKYSQCPHHMLPACWRHLLCLLNCPQGKLGCISCTGACCVTEPIPLHTKTNPVEQQFPVHLQLNESKVRLSCSGDFD